MSGVGIIVGKKACCCPRGCTRLDLASWLAPAGKYAELAISGQFSGNWYRVPYSPGACSASWNASFGGGDAYRYGGDYLTYPSWYSRDYTIGGGSHPSMYGLVTTNVGVLDQSISGGGGSGGGINNWPEIHAAAPACPGQPNQDVFRGFSVFVRVTYYTDDQAAACYPFVGMGPSQDTTGFAVSYVKRCCNFQEGPVGTYHRLGPATITDGPRPADYTGGYGGPTHTVFFTRTAGDTVTVTDTPT